MTRSVHGDGSVLVFALLALVHGWAWIVHTDWTHEGQQHGTIVCPECDQDRARLEGDGVRDGRDEQQHEDGGEQSIGQGQAHASHLPVAPASQP